MASEQQESPIYSPAHAWLADARRNGLRVIAFDGDLYLFGDKQAKVYKDLRARLVPHEDAVIAILSHDDPELCYAAVRSMFADPGDLEGHR